MEKISTFLAEGTTGAVASSPPSGAVDDLRASVAATVLRHPGVLRIEPTLAGSLQARGGPGASSSTGVVVDLRGGVVDGEVNISTRVGHQVLRTVSELQGRLTDLVAEHGLVCAGVAISVLCLEADDDPSCVAS